MYKVDADIKSSISRGGVTLAPSRRINAVDALRGVALLGVFLANVPVADQMTVSSSDQVIFMIKQVVIDHKFIALFSILFGFGFSVQIEQGKAGGKNIVRYWTNRMLVLFLIGTVHAFLFWYGDILRAYALGGMLLLLFRDWPVRRLLVAAFLIAVVGTAIVFIGNSTLGWRDYHYDYALAYELPMTTSWLRYWTINAIIDPWVNFSKDMPITLMYTFGNMLLGLALGRIGFFIKNRRSRLLRRRLVLAGILLGLPSSYILHQIMSGQLVLHAGMLWIPFVVVFGMILQSLMYASLLLELFYGYRARRVLKSFTHVGRASLTNYLGQSLVFILLFFHVSPFSGLYGTLTLGQSYLLVFCLFGFQMVNSYLWLSHFRKGPVEALYRGVRFWS